MEVNLQPRVLQLAVPEQEIQMFLEALNGSDNKYLRGLADQIAARYGFTLGLHPKAPAAS